MQRRQRYVSRELHHFIGRSRQNDEERYDDLLAIIRSGELRPSRLGEVGAEEGAASAGVSFNPAAKISQNEAVVPEVVCFCDIPADDLHIHMDKYSRFGISFLKTFLLPRGVNPVFYIANDSRSRHGGDHDDQSRGELFDSRVSAMLEQFPAVSAKLGLNTLEGMRYSRGHSFSILHVFAFVKAFDALDATGELRSDENDENYYLEREWRVLGRVQFSQDDVYRVTLPKAYAGRFRTDCPQYHGQLTFAEA